MLNLSVRETLQELDKERFPAQGELYCPSCGDFRRMDVSKLWLQPLDRQPITPKLYKYTCVQCKTTFTALIYEGPDGPTLTVLPSCRGGLTTPHTPSGVSYYLDQASKAQSIGANSAAIAMFRGALDHLLFEQGYVKGMLGNKLDQLEKDITNNIAPKWAMELDVEFLSVMKELGNGAIHPNDGDITKQSALDNDLIEGVKETFLMLLYLVYEHPHQKMQKLNALKAKAAILKK